MLDGAGDWEWTTRTTRVPETVAVSGSIGVRSEAGSMTEMDLARLIVIDYPPGLTPLALGSELAIGSLVLPISAKTAENDDIVLLSNSKDPRLLVAAGSKIVLEWSSGVAVDAVALECARVGEPFAVHERGVDVQVMTDMGWNTVDRVHPRRRVDMLAGATTRVNRARLVFNTDVLVSGILGFVRDLGAEERTTIHRSEVLSLGPEDPRNALGASDGSAVSLREGQELQLRFVVPAGGEAANRAAFLELRARITGPSTASGQSAASAELRASSSDHSIRFGLREAVPNPAFQSTALTLDLPRRSHVSVEVFDPQGRRVTTLLNEARAKGTHSLNWDGRDVSGVRVRPGLYIIRLQAGQLSARRRVILLP